MITSYFIYLTPDLSPICMPSTPSRAVCGRSPSRHRNCFPAWSQHCAGSPTIWNYSGFETPENLPKVGRLLCQPVSQPYSSGYIHLSRRAPPSLRPLRLARQVLQVPDGPTWKIIGFSGMGGDCNVPPPGWFAWPQKTSRVSSAHRAQQAPHAENQDLWDQWPPFPTRKGLPSGNSSLHLHYGSQLTRPHSPPHCRPGHIWLLLLPTVLRIHKVHQPLPDGPILALNGLRVLLWGLLISPGTPPLIIYAMPSKFASPSTTRRMPSVVRPSPTSVLSLTHPAHSRCASAFSSTCVIKDAIPPPPSAILLLIIASALSGNPTSLPSSGPHVCKWERTYLDSPQKMSERTLSDLSEPWPCTSPMSQTGHSWSLADGSH